MLKRTVKISLLFCSLAATAQDTELKLYRPYAEAIGQVSPQVKTSISGACYTQSRLILREDAWRCIADGRTYDPCFVKSGQNRTEALCPKSPWVADSVLIRVKEPLNNEQNKPLDMSRTYPWGIELTNGEYCTKLPSGQKFEQMPVRYQCTNENYLIGYLQRCKSTWSMLEKTPKGIETVEFRKVWF